MNRLNNPAELEIFRQDILKRRERIKKRVRVCAGPACASHAGEAIAKALQDLIVEKGLQEEFWVTPTGCHGFCSRGPIAVIEPENIFYEKLRLRHVPEIVERTLIGGEIIEKLLYTHPADGKKIVHEADLPFYANQEQIVSRDSGRNLLFGYRGLYLPGRVCRTGQGPLRGDTRRTHRRNQAFRPQGPRGGRFSYRDQMGILPEGQRRH